MHVSVSLEDRIYVPDTQLPWRTIILVLATAVGIVVLATLAGFGASAVFDSWTRLNEPRAFAAGETEALLTARVAVSLFAFQSVTILLVFATSVFLDYSGEPFLRFGMPRGGLKTLVLSALGLMALALLYGCLVFAVDKDAFRQDMSPFASLMKARTWWLVLIAAGIGAPLAEECLFRGLLYGALRRSPLGIAGAAAATAIMWAFLHANYSVYGLVAITLIGIYLAFIRERTGSLLTPILCHGAYNSLIVLVLAYAPNSSLING